MATVIVIESNSLLRLGIEQTLQTMTFGVDVSGMDYAQLFNGKQVASRADLALLSVPDNCQRIMELVDATQKSCHPERLLLLGGSSVPSCSLKGLPSLIAGYVSVHASPDMLKAAVMLVLAGGVCFPSAEGEPGVDSSESPVTYPKDSAGSTPRRRWYDRDQPITPSVSSDKEAPVNLLPSNSNKESMIPSATSGFTEETLDSVPFCHSVLAVREAELLALTPRQYEVLVLLSKGHPFKKVAVELDVSVATVKAHAETIYRRLAVHNRYAAVYAAISKGATLGMKETTKAHST